MLLKRAQQQETTEKLAFKYKNVKYRYKSFCLLYQGMLGGLCKIFLYPQAFLYILPFIRRDYV